MTRFEELYRGDANFSAALEAMQYAMARALRIADPDPDRQLFEIAGQHDRLRGMCFATAADMLRDIGHARATPAVVASQLKLKGLRDEAVLTGIERVGIEVFLFTLASLDGFAKAEADRLAAEKAEAERKDPPKVPIEDTTLEPVDGPMDTWRV